MSRALLAPALHEPAGAVAPGASQQKDCLCGAFCGAGVLAEAGIASWRGEPVDQDLVARVAGTTLPEEPSAELLPPGARSLTAYRYELARVAPERSGTAAGALKAAIEELSAGSLVAVGLRGSWTAAVVEGLLDGVDRVLAGPGRVAAPPGSSPGARHGGVWPRSVRLVANLRTGRLWSSHTPLEVLYSELIGGDAEATAADWDVGHFVVLEYLVKGPGGSLVSVQDTYPCLGRDGHHLQPARAVAAALDRGDGLGGGVLAVAPAAAKGRVEQLGRGLGLAVEIWDNGSSTRR